ncbi:KAP family P-loop NTPase fold protein [Rahnella inusitata]|uniref:NTPase n=1 Tax=Rahnella inusitata TaxID=58169 RepID=A0ABX9P968_9GAMM|nr:P-loop NTPase fold protein [Rahnella inusitata]RJT16258.1 NTPase [Rahnella inusitata]
MINASSDVTFEIRDEYKRKEIAIKINELLDSDVDISPLVIDGGWGTGKTEFCLKLTNMLNENTENPRAVYIDAFKEDHTDAPLLTILAAIIALLPKNEAKNLIAKALPALKFGLKTGLKATAGWLLKQNADELSSEFADAISDTNDAIIDKTVESMLHEHIDAEKNIQTLKSALKEITQSQPLIIIIDELDRCKPSFSVSIIENIKHVFDVENVNFILVTNTAQLYASINHMYGSAVNSRQYLDKFIKFSITLPTFYKPHGTTPTNASLRHWKNISQDDETLLRANSGSEKMITSLINHGELSLREVETFARHIKIFQILTQNSIDSNSNTDYNYLEIFGIFLYCFDKKSAKSILNRSINLDAIGDTLNIKEFNYIRNRDQSTIQILLYGLIRDSDYPSFRFPRPDDEQKVKWDYYLTGSYQTINYDDKGFSSIVAAAISNIMLSS